MNEYKQIIEAYDQIVESGKKCALVSVVHLDGSSYRSPGARMLVAEDGQMTGAISGGCLEGDALRKALLVMVQQQSKIVTYDSTDEDDAFFGAQLGCEGIIQVLFEPIHSNHSSNPISLLKKIMNRRQNCILVTIFDLKNKLQPQLGTCLLVEETGEIHGQISDEVLKKAVLGSVEETFKNKKSTFIAFESETESKTAFIEWISPPLSVVIVGAGNDALPLVNMVDALGWKAHVVDGRHNLAKEERFVNACQVLVSKPENILANFEMDDYTAFVLMTHNYKYDLGLLKHLIFKPIRYIGVLGPKKKMERMYDDLAKLDIELTEDQKANIYGPVGLEIGAETPEEIALSIIAEIKAVFSNKPGGSLRTKADTIHSRKNTEIHHKKIG
ncbi:MAG TPA: XdhC family protein [Saprospiraceae bacterium]|nr:XdhC family protein [Saprospiraceae bacterium]